jgi:hypothetical protein
LAQGFQANTRIIQPHFDFWPHDANMHISFLFTYLCNLKEQSKLGKRLMLQMNICWRDNLYFYWTSDEFWNNFVAQAFCKTSKKLGTLEHVMIWNWKNWMERYLRKMKFHSFQRAFLLTKEYGKPVLRIKTHILKTNWRSLKNAPKNGLEIVRPFPAYTHPDVLLTLLPNRF